MLFESETASLDCQRWDKERRDYLEVFSFCRSLRVAMFNGATKEGLVAMCRLSIKRKNHSLLMVFGT